MTDDQGAVIIGFMASHTAFAFNKALGSNPKFMKDKLWKDLKELVDKSEGSEKTIAQIQSVSIFFMKNQKFVLRI